MCCAIKDISARNFAIILEKILGIQTNNKQHSACQRSVSCILTHELIIHTILVAPCSPTFNVDLVNVLYISVFIWTTKAPTRVAAILSTIFDTRELRDVVDQMPSSSRSKVYRVIDISRVCEFYVIRIARSWHVCMGRGMGERGEGG